MYLEATEHNKKLIQDFLKKPILVILKKDNGSEYYKYEFELQWLVNYSIGEISENILVQRNLFKQDIYKTVTKTYIKGLWFRTATQRAAKSEIQNYLDLKYVDGLRFLNAKHNDYIRLKEQFTLVGIEFVDKPN